MDYLASAKQRFANDLFATETTGVEILDVKPNYARCTLKISTKHRNAMGAVMGGAIFTLADFAFAVAANAETLQTVSTNSSISYLASSKGNELFAETHCLKDGRTTCFFETLVTDEKNTLIAKISTVGTKLHSNKLEK